MTTPEAHHAQDVGRILLQAQADLRSIREKLSTDGGEAEWHREHLQQVVEKAESDLKLKAEAMLTTVVNGAATLPAIGAYNFRTDARTSTPIVAPPPRAALQLPARTRSAGETRPGAAHAARHIQTNAVNNPAGNRQYLAERFGIEQPVPSTKGNVARPIGRASLGKLRKEKIAHAKGVLDRSSRRDPHATPPIGPKDVAAGLFSLVNRGLVPAHVDLTPALARHPAPVLQAPSRMHPHKDQFASHNSSAYISPFGFNVSNTKLDLLSGAARAGAGSDPPTRPRPLSLLHRSPPLLA